MACLIRLVTRSKWNHALLLLGDDSCVEAEPSGAALGTGSAYATQEVSALVLSSVQVEAVCAAALSLVGTPYGFLDIVSVGLLQYGIRLGFIRRRVERSNCLICSQLVDECYRRAGVHLFSDGRIPMDVTPGDLARLVEGC